MKLFIVKPMGDILDFNISASVISQCIEKGESVFNDFVSVQRKPSHESGVCGVIEFFLNEDHVQSDPHYNYYFVSLIYILREMGHEIEPTTKVLSVKLADIATRYSLTLGVEVEPAIQPVVVTIRKGKVEVKLELEINPKMDKLIFQEKYLAQHSEKLSNLTAFLMESFDSLSELPSDKLATFVTNTLMVEQLRLQYEKNTRYISLNSVTEADLETINRFALSYED